MNKTTGVVLQVAEGLFGWIWLLSVPVNFWFFISIFISDGTWGRFFAGAIVAFVSKRLMVGFMNMRRVASYSDANVPSTEAKGVKSLTQEILSLSPHEPRIVT